MLRLEPGKALARLETGLPRIRLILESGSSDLI